MFEHYWGGNGWATYDRGDFGASEILLGPEGAEWTDHEAMVCVSLPSVEVVCIQHVDNKWQTVWLMEEADITDGSGFDDGSRITALQAPIVVRYVKDDDVYFRVFVLAWEENVFYGDSDLGVWKLLSLEREHGAPDGWTSEVGNRRWRDHGSAPNVAVAKGAAWEGTKRDYSYSLTAWSAFEFDTDDSWVNLFGHDWDGNNIVDFYFDARTRTWQWGNGQPTPSSQFRVSSAIAVRDPQGDFRVSAFGSSPNGVFERFFDTARGSVWTFLNL